MFRKMQQDKQQKQFTRDFFRLKLFRPAMEDNTQAVLKDWGCHGHCEQRICN